MPELKEGSFTLNFGVVKLGGKLSEMDRQCAWELYTEIVTRVAVTGKRRDETSTDFSGEIFVESLKSLYLFFNEARGIMRRFPIGKIKKKHQQHLGRLIHDLLTDVLRPFLEKWQADLRSWWGAQQAEGQDWFAIQVNYPRKDELLAEWTDLRKLMRRFEHQLRREYKLTSADLG